MLISIFCLPPYMSHPTRGAWIEMSPFDPFRPSGPESHPTRGAWIEIFGRKVIQDALVVAPHTGCVD